MRKAVFFNPDFVKVASFNFCIRDTTELWCSIEIGLTELNVAVLHKACAKYLVHFSFLTRHNFDTTIYKQIQIRHEPSYKQLEVKTNRTWFCAIFLLHFHPQYSSRQFGKVYIFYHSTNTCLRCGQLGTTHLLIEVKAFKNILPRRNCFLKFQYHPIMSWLCSLVR
jgi:hypothetical protein